MSVNKVTIVGVITSDITQLQDKSFFTVATDSRTKDFIKREFHRVIAIGEVAEFLKDRRIERGQKIYLEASIQYDENNKADLLARKVEIL